MIVSFDFLALIIISGPANSIMKCSNKLATLITSNALQSNSTSLTSNVAALVNSNSAISGTGILTGNCAKNGSDSFVGTFLLNNVLNKLLT